MRNIAMSLLKKIVVYPLGWINSLKTYVIKKRFSECGEHLEVGGFPSISCPSRIKVGSNVNLNRSCVLNATDSSIHIGDNCTISEGAKILAATLDVDDYIFNRHKQHISKPIFIGDNVWVCAGAVICPGVHIMGGAIIAAGSVVTKDIKDHNVLVAGNPARIVKRF